MNVDLSGKEFEKKFFNDQVTVGLDLTPTGDVSVEVKASVLGLAKAGVEKIERPWLKGILTKVVALMEAAKALQVKALADAPVAPGSPVGTPPPGAVQEGV